VKFVVLSYLARQTSWSGLKPGGEGWTTTIELRQMLARES